MINSKIFREYDIRGVVGQDFDSAGVVMLGRAFASYVRKAIGNCKIVVAYDGRLSSPDIEQKLVEGLVKSGAEVIRIGCGPTPMLYFASHYYKADGAIMITGSHNPPEFNGFKLVVGQQAIFGQEIANLYQIIKQQDFVKDDGQAVTNIINDEYVSYLLNDFNTHYQDIKLKVAWDPGNGAAGEVLQSILEQIDGEHYVINEQIDGTFPAHHPDPTIPENLEQLKELVLTMDCDFGIAFDGDGDRIGIVDKDGEILFGDQILCLFADEVLFSHPNATIVADVKTSQTFFDYVKRQEGKPLMWKTGHSLVKKKMRQVNSPLGGEMSGHIFFADRYYGFDDAIYAALRFIGLVNHNNIALDQWIANLPKMYSTPEIRIPCEELDKFGLIEQIKEFLQTDNVAFNDIDGIRVTLDDGWWLLRASNTQEIIVARAESQSERKLITILNTIALYLERAGIERNTWLD